MIIMIMHSYHTLVCLSIRNTALPLPYEPEFPLVFVGSYQWKQTIQAWIFKVHSVIGEMWLITHRALFGMRSHGILWMRSMTASLFHHPKTGKVHNPDEAWNKPGAALSIFCTLTLIFIPFLKRKKKIWTAQQYCAGFEKCSCTIWVVWNTALYKACGFCKGTPTTKVTVYHAVNKALNEDYKDTEERAAFSTAKEQQQTCVISF